MEPDEFKLEQPCVDPCTKKRLLWCSDRDRGETYDYYSDQLWLKKMGDGKWCLELKVGGTVHVCPVKDIEKYV